ncbi:MAG TPA: PAS domain-containing protein, partial [Aggregicoccus sp.]|nr:PAS domain-containing protein [Aggregicoccus sp.]
MARGLQVERAAPCLHFEAVRAGDGALRDFTGTSLNAAAEALVRDYRLGRQQQLWTAPEASERGASPGLLDFHALARVVDTGEPYSRDLRLRGGPGGGELWLRATALKRGDGFELWLAEAAPARESESGLLEALAEEREARREAERALQIYDGLLADAPVGMGLLDLDLQHRLVNPALAQMEGISDVSGKGSALGASLAPHLAPVLAPLCRLALEVGGPVVAELSPETWSGVPLGGDWQVVAFPVGLGQGGGAGPGGAHGVGLSLTDISERKRAERMLGAREEHLRLALETANMVAWEWTYEQRRVSWSPRAERFFGLEPGGLGDTLERFLGCVHPEDREMVKEALSRGQEAQGAYAFRFRGVWPSGRVRTYETTGQTFHDEDGRPARMVGVVLDCTERERAEEKMRAAAERYRLASTATHDVLWELNLSTGNVYWGEAGTDVFGYRVDEVGHDLAWWRQQVHPEDRARAADSLQTLLHGREDSWREEYRFRRADGEYIHVLDRGVVVRDERGRPLRMVGNMTDITERKRALELMEREAEFRERFIGILGHDLRNPLNAITLGAQALLRQETLGANATRIAVRVLAAAERGTRMVLDLLDFTQARLG